MTFREMNNQTGTQDVEDISVNWQTVDTDGVQQLLEQIRRKESDIETELEVIRDARFEMEMNRQEIKAYRDEVKADLEKIKAARAEIAAERQEMRTERAEFEIEKEQFWVTLKAARIRQEAFNTQHEQMAWNQARINRDHEVQLEKIREVVQTNQNLFNEEQDWVMDELEDITWYLCNFKFEQDDRFSDFEGFVDGYRRLNVVQARINCDQAEINRLNAVFQSKHIS